jgi:hypothetical protein
VLVEKLVEIKLYVQERASRQQVRVEKHIVMAVDDLMLGEIKK